MQIYFSKYGNRVLTLTPKFPLPSHGRGDLIAVCLPLSSLAGEGAGGWGKSAAYPE